MEFPCRAFLCACGGRYAPPPHAWGIRDHGAYQQEHDPVHPHVRGEYVPSATDQRSSSGSSPRAWGIHFVDPLEHAIGRFIPTCVGNTGRTGRPKYTGAVHPHVRGEYGTASTADGMVAGSSPRAWGIQTDALSSVAVVRFIPTCVGNTRTRDAQIETAAVHPHVRGEYKGQVGLHQFSCGSSPRAWGILAQRDHDLDAARFIPTCVGNTLSGPWPAPHRSVHPHVRGEYSSRKHEEFSKVIIAAKIYQSGTA